MPDPSSSPTMVAMVHGSLTDGPHAILELMEGRRIDYDFVGRTQELAQILEAADEAAAGEPRLLLIGGEAGIGKTRLVEQVGSVLTRRGVRFAVGACVEFGVDGVPLAPLAQLLRGLAAGPGLPGGGTASGAVLADLLPGPVGRGSAPEQAFHAILGLIEQVAAAGTTVLVFEDVHDADSATAALLGFLSRALQNVNVLIIVTYRTDLYRRRPRLAGLLEDLDRRRLTTRIELGRFRRTEVAAQLRGILGYAVDEALMQQIYARGEGNPYFTEILARDLRKPDGALPITLRDTLVSRLYQLPDATRRILRVLAAGGLEVSHDLLAKVAELRGTHLTEALRPAIVEGIIELGPDHSGYRFRHALTHEAVEQDLMPGEHTELHLAYAEALEESGVSLLDGNATEIARHRYAAHDIKNAFPALLRAAEVAASRFAFVEELRMLEQALEIWGLVSLELRPPQEKLLYRAAVAAGRAGQDGRALSFAEAGLNLVSGPGGDRALTARFLVERAKSIKILSHGDGVEELRRAIEIFRELGMDAENASAHSELAHTYMCTDRHQLAVDVAQVGIELARRAKSKPDELHMRITQGWCLGVTGGNIPHGLTLLRLACREAAAVGNAALAGRAAINLSSVLNTLGRYAEALEVVREALRSLRTGLPMRIEIILRLNAVEALSPLGEWDEAVLMLEQALAKGSTGIGAAGIWGELANIALARGQVEQAKDFLEHCWQQGGRTSKEAQFTISFFRIDAELAWSEGRIGDVRGALQYAAGLSGVTALDEYVWPLIIAVARAEADCSEQRRSLGLRPEPESAESIRKLRELADRQVLPNPTWQVYAAIATAEYARCFGDETAQAWETARRLAEQHFVAPHRRAYILFRCAQCEYDAGNDDRAVELAAQARGLANKIGLRPLLDDLSRLEPEPGQADAAARIGLTPRELEVLRLVAEGKTNGQIGGILYITTKTVSTHVSKILDKLQVATRTEAAKAARELGLI